MAISQTLISQAGPLPITVSFEPLSDASIVFILSGSVWTHNAGQLIGIELDIDGKKVGATQIFANAAATHMAVVSIAVSAQLDFGAHKITLSPLNAATVSDFNDNYQLTALY